MAGDWIQVRTDLWSDPRVIRVQLLTQLPRAFVLGALVRLWALADEYSLDGLIPSMTPEALDLEVGMEGFAEALQDRLVGWLLVEDTGLRIPRFEEYNGRTAKRRSLESRRKRNSRDADGGPPTGGRRADTMRTPCGHHADATRKACGEGAGLDDTRGEDTQKTEPVGADAPLAGGSAARPASAQGGALFPDGEPAPSKPKRQRKPRKPPDPTVAAFREWWAAQWQKARGAAWKWDAKQSKAAVRVLGKADGDLSEAQGRAMRMLEGLGGRDRWMAQNASPALLESRWNELSAELEDRPRPASAKAAANQETLRRSQERLRRFAEANGAAPDSYPEPEQIPEEHP